MQIPQNKIVVIFMCQLNDRQKVVQPFTFLQKVTFIRTSKKSHPFLTAVALAASVAACTPNSPEESAPLNPQLTPLSSLIKAESNPSFNPDRTSVQPTVSVLCQSVEAFTPNIDSEELEKADGVSEALLSCPPFFETPNDSYFQISDPTGTLSINGLTGKVGVFCSGPMKNVGIPENGFFIPEYQCRNGSAPLIVEF